MKRRVVLEVRNIIPGQEGNELYTNHCNRHRRVYLIEKSQQNRLRRLFVFFNVLR